MNRPPAFQFYPKDWDDFKVQRMTHEAQGIYIRILCFMWKDSRDQCSILNDDKAIAKSLGVSIRKWLSIKKEIQYKNDPLLKENDTKLISIRLKKEARKLREYRKKQSEKGKKSALSRGTTVEPQLNHSANQKTTEAQPEGNSSSSSSSSSIIKNKKTGEKPLPQHKRIKFSFKKEEWQGILVEDKSQWKAGCPDVDIEKQLYKMKNWLIANPNKAKKNYAQFIVNWLNSEQGKIDAKNRYNETDKKEIDDWVKEPIEKGKK